MVGGLFVVEFQPSGWSRGSYLNVGCMWLWNVRPHVSFDVGYRVEGYRQIESGQQSEELAERLAARSLEKVLEYRRLFPTVQQVSEYYEQNTPNGFWPHFNAAVAHTLSGRVEVGCRVLSQCLAQTDDEPAWLSEARRVARTLATMMHEQPRAQKFVSDRVQETRRLQKLPPLNHIDFGC